MRALRVHDLSVRFGSLEALASVDLALAAGQATMLVGPNGAGKSTLIKVLLGLIRPDSGRFEIDGRAATVDNDWKRATGYLPEAVAFSENLTGLQLLRFFANARGVSRDRVDTVLGRVGLRDASRRTIRGYSRGMRQRLGLGVAILSEPDLLVLDEPTAGLDQEGLSVLWSVMSEWRERDRMVLASTHDLALMERHVDDICVLRDGHVLAHGDLDALRERASLPHRIWLDVDPAADAKTELLCEAMRRWGKGRIERDEDRILAEVSADETLELLEIQGSFPGVVRRIRIEEPTLDVIYDKLLGAA